MGAVDGIRASISVGSPVAARRRTSRDTDAGNLILTWTVDEHRFL